MCVCVRERERERETEREREGWVGTVCVCNQFFALRSQFLFFFSFLFLIIKFIMYISTIGITSPPPHSSPVDVGYLSLRPLAYGGKVTSCHDDTGTQSSGDDIILDSSWRWLRGGKKLMAIVIILFIPLFKYNYCPALMETKTSWQSVPAAGNGW